MFINDYPLIDIKTVPWWTDYPDITNFNSNIFDNIDNFSFFLYYLQRPLTFASLTDNQFPQLYIEDEEIKIISCIKSIGDLLFCVILKYRNYLFVIFKGTTHYSEQIIDTKLSFYETCRKEKVHYGFAKYYSYMKEEIIRTILDNPTSQLVVSGVSLGSCISYLLLVDMKDYLYKYVHVKSIVFAPPRCGNDAFYSYMMNNLGNIVDFKGYVNTVDIIPKLPPFFYGNLKKCYKFFKINKGNVYENHISAYYDYFYNKGCNISFPKNVFN
jgi:hypothetical protein